MKNVQFQENAYEELIEWAATDTEIFFKIDRLIRDISRDPFKGLGKPELLKYQYKGFWSRRITQEHRLIYRLVNDVIIIVSLKGHYDD
jgi:toxin YoeB